MRSLLNKDFVKSNNNFKELFLLKFPDHLYLFIFEEKTKGSCSTELEIHFQNKHSFNIEHFTFYILQITSLQTTK